MNYAKYITYTFLKIAAISATVFLFSASYTYAVVELPSLVVKFESAPLFKEVNIIPGDGVTKTVTVTNNSGESQDIIVEATKAIDDDGLGDVLNLVISEASNKFYDDTLGSFLRNGEVSLSALSSGGTRVYSFAVSFEDGADNSTQDSMLGFDLCVGFEGGESRCGDTVIGGEGDTGDGGDDGGGGGGETIIPGSGGGGGGGAPILYIYNETVASTTPLGIAVITWRTNYLSTSQVIYGIDTGAPYALNLTLPNFGYPSSTPDDLTKVMNHSVTLTGLIPGETYLYRVVSHASPPTVGFEYAFTVVVAASASEIQELGGEPGQQGGNNEENTGSAAGSGLPYGNEGGGEGTAGAIAGDGNGTSTESGINTVGENKESANGASLAASILGIFGNWSKLFGWLLLILLLIVLVIIIIRRRNRE